MFTFKSGRRQIKILCAGADYRRRETEGERGREGNQIAVRVDTGMGITIALYVSITVIHRRTTGGKCVVEECFMTNVFFFSCFPETYTT